MSAALVRPEQAKAPSGGGEDIECQAWGQA
jgi:hypothetical protein